MDIRPLSSSVPAAPLANDSAAPAPARTAAPVHIADPVLEASPAPTMQQLADAVKSLNKAMQAQAQGVEFSIDSESDKTVVKVIDHETKEILRQIPSAEALEIARALDKAQGLLIRQKA